MLLQSSSVERNYIAFCCWVCLLLIGTKNQNLGMRVNHLSLDLENGDRQWINDQLEISFLAKYSLRWLEGVAESMRSDYACLKQLSTMFAHFKTSDHQNQLMMECVMWYSVYRCFIDDFVNAQTAGFWIILSIIDLTARKCDYNAEIYGKSHSKPSLYSETGYI